MSRWGVGKPHFIDSILNAKNTAQLYKRAFYPLLRNMLQPKSNLYFNRITLQNVWDTIQSKKFTELINIMLNRIKCVIQNKVVTTEYLIFTELS